MTLNIKHHDIEIPPTSPFLNCKLNRKKYADVLTTILTSYGDGFVLAIDNPWGTGKTTFIKMWQQELKNQEIRTIYFNAWENDFENNSLAALLSELKTIENKKDAFKPLLKKGTILAKNLIPALVKAIASKYIDIKELPNLIENTVKAGTEILEDEINIYTSKKEGIKDFKVELSKYVQNGNNGKPLIFFIDELDRCNPNYAVEVLEQVKHFFSVSGIIFILSIDKQQLGNSIRGYYGSDQINADEYLRRFIDIEYSIPKPDTKEFCTYLYDYYNFDEFFQASERIKHNELREDKSNFITFSSNLFSDNKLTLRQQEKAFSHARLVMKTFPFNSYVFPSVFLLIIYTKFFKNGIYVKIQTKELTNQELINHLESLIGSQAKGSFLHSFSYAIGQFVWMYNNYLGNFRGNTLYTNESSNNSYTLLVKSNLLTESERGLLDIFKHLGKERGLDISIDYFLKKVDLLENLSA